MADEQVTLEQLVVSDALVQAPDRRGVITDEEFKTQLEAERANYIAVLKRLH